MKIRFRLKLCSLVLVLLLIIPNIAYAAEYDNKDISVQNEITPRVMYIKELLRYDSTVNKTNWTYKLVGSVSGNNLKNPYTKLHLDFAYNTSGSLVYKVCNLDYPKNWWTETKVVNNAFAPAESHIHTTMEVYNYVP